MKKRAFCAGFIVRYSSFVILTVLATEIPARALSYTDEANWADAWYVREGKGSPSNNSFRRSNVKFLSSGQISLGISNDANEWTSSELYSTKKFGYGQFYIEVEFNSTIEPNVVFGAFLFPYGRKIGSPTQEIDVEFSKWARVRSENLKLTVYPYENMPGKPPSADFKFDGNRAYIYMRWRKDGVFYHVSSLDGDDVLWEYRSVNDWDVPRPPLNFVFNFWIFRGVIGSQKNENVLIRKFLYFPD